MNNAWRGSSGADLVKWLLLDLNSFFASCEQQENPALRGRPIAVVPLLSDTTCAIAASYPAKACGIKTGTRVSEAKRLCPEIIFIEARHAIYIEYHHRIVAAVDRCVPVDQIWSIDEMLCQLTHEQCLLPNALALAKKIKVTIAREVGACLTSSIGLAPNPFLAKIASNRQKPDGLTVIRQSDLPDALYPLRLRDLTGIGVNLERRLMAAGICDIRALCAATREELKAIWGGVNGLRYHAMLRGEAVFWPISDACRSIGHQHVLAPKLRALERARPIARGLLVNAAIRLRRNRMVARRITLHVAWIGNRPDTALSRRVNETADTAMLLRMFEILWAELSAGKPLRVGVTLTELGRAGEAQLDLLTSRHRERLMQLIDGLNERFGRETVAFGNVPERLRTAKIAFRRIPHRLEV